MPRVREQIPFRFLVQRDPWNPGTFNARFEVDRGRGILRVARPGVLVDPPAAKEGREDGLTADQLRASRFLQVELWSRNRRTWSLEALDDGSLDRLPSAEWVLLVPSAEAWQDQLVVEDLSAEDEKSDPLDEVTNPADGRSTGTEGIRRALLDAPLPLGTSDGASQLRRGSLDVTVIPPNRDDGSPRIGPLPEVGTRPEPMGSPLRVFVQPAVSPGLEPAPSPVMAEELPPEDLEPTPTTSERHREPAPPPPVAPAPAPSEPQDPSLASSLPPYPALIRHLRRQASRTELEILELRARLAALEGPPAAPDGPPGFDDNL